MINTTLQPALELVSGALSELSQLDQWVIWKPIHGQKVPLKRDDSGDKPRLVGASHSEPADWTSYTSARASQAELRGRGTGFVFSEYDPYTGVDLDGCRDKDTGIIEPWAQRWIRALDSYSEISPSETGVKLWVRGTLPEELKHSFGPHIGIEVYSKNRYFAFTGKHLAGTPTEIRDAQYVLDLMWAEYHKEPEPAAPRKEYKVSKGEAANDRQNARDVIATLNRSNDAGDYLEHKGATLIRTRGDKRYYTGLAGDQHANGQTYIVSPAKDGNGHICFSYSPNGKLSKTDFPRGFRWFDAICALEHSGDVTAALKELNPIQPRKARPAAPQPATVYRTAEMDADAERKRAERRTAAAATLAEIQARASQDASLSDRAQLVLLALLETAGSRDWTRASVARLAELTELCERYVHEGLRELEDGSRPGGAYITSGRRNGSTTFRTFLRLQDYVKYADEYRYIACEGGASPASDENTHTDTIEAWHAADDGHGADELSALELLPEECNISATFSGTLETAPAQQEAPNAPTLLDQCGKWRLECYRGMWALRGPNAECEWLGRDENNARIALAVKNLPITGQTVHIHDGVLVEPFDDSGQPECATYTPVEIPSHKPYSGITKHTQDTEARYALVWETMKPREQPAGTINLLATVEPDDDMPLVRKRPKKERTPALDRYLVELAGMSESELAGELRKHKATLKKHAGKVWLSGIRDRLGLVEQEIDARDLHGAAHTPPLTSSGPKARPASIQQGAFI